VTVGGLTAVETVKKLQMPIAPDISSTDTADPNLQSGPAQEQADQLAEMDPVIQEKPNGPEKPVAVGGIPIQAPIVKLGAAHLRKMGNAGHRASPRYMVRWKMALVFDGAEGKPIFHGWTFDLSMSGTAMLADNNVYTEAPVTVLLAPPPLIKDGSSKIIEIQARQVYSVYSGALSCFRLGLNFTKFKGDGMETLKEMLAHYRSSEYKGDKLIN